MTRAVRRRAYALLCAAVLVAAAGVAYAGNIDPNNTGDHFAWAENVGWFNFKPDQGPGVTVFADKLTGFAFAENIGWINLNPMDGGVLNDGVGRLSGFAWGENVGWINFAPTGGGVSIDMSKGRFSGFAWGENIGWINFSVMPGVVTSFTPEKGVPAVGPWGLVALALALAGLGFSRRGVRVRAAH
jgi:hypothetical protein